MKLEFNAKGELYDIGCIETVINSYQQGNATVEELFLARNVCKGKIKYFSKFKKNAGMIYTHLLIYIDGLRDNDVDKMRASYNAYEKYFKKVFGHMVGGAK